MPITSQRETAGRAWTPGPALVSGDIHNVEGRLLWCGSISPDAAIGEYRGDIARVQSCAHIDGISNEEAEANAAFIADAFNVTHETGLTPRQIAEQRADLLQALREIETICTESNGDCRKRMGTRVGNILIETRAALSRAGEVDHG